MNGRPTPLTDTGLLGNREPTNTTRVGPTGPFIVPPPMKPPRKPAKFPPPAPPYMPLPPLRIPPPPRWAVATPPTNKPHRITCLRNRMEMSSSPKSVHPPGPYRIGIAPVQIPPTLDAVP